MDERIPTESEEAWPEAGRPGRRAASGPLPGGRRSRFGRSFVIAACVLACILGSIGLSTVSSVVQRGQGAPGPPRMPSGDPPPAIVVDGLELPARVQGSLVRPAVAGRFVPRFWAGVNIGSTIPGTQPGEVAATRTIYDRWFAELGKLHATVVRVYTILKPDFYDALRAYDLTHPDHPIYVIQGVWLPDEPRFYATGNAYDPQVTRTFRSEIEDAVAVVHGDADIPERHGHASGRFTSDISRWVLAWSVGIEWDPDATQSTDRKNAGRPAFQGRYIGAQPGSTPMESWIASMLDYTASLEAGRGWSRPLTFTDWLTTDPLHHPDEPLVKEDLVSIDPAHLHAAAAWPAGFFASYHAYPYYPDFLRVQPSYQRYRRPRDGRIDPYAGYLHELRRHHRGQALMITEFGVPTSLGRAHFGPMGRDQGDHSEREAARIDVDMLRDMRDEGLAGGVLFEWIDEWFKFTWNTLDYELPHERRGMWRNPLTNEEHFGVLAAEEGRTTKVVLDGRDDEWARNGSRVIARSTGPVREVRALHDEEYLFLRILLDRPRWQSEALTVGIDARPGGNRGLPGEPGVYRRADVAVRIGPGERAQLRQAAWTDPIAFQFGVHRPYVPVAPGSLGRGSGAWVSPRQILNRPYLIPTTRRLHPPEVVDIGRLPWGPTDPARPGFDDRHLVMASGRVIEMRLPWSMLTFADPSRHLVEVPHPDGTITTLRVEKLGIAVSPPHAPLLRTTGYDWPGWNAVTWHERPKQGVPILEHAFAGYAGRG